MEKKAVIQPQDKYVLRLPDGMRDRIKAAAEKNNRSMNAEIVAALEEAFPEGMALGDFIQMWVAPITTADVKEKAALATFANEAAASANSIYRVKLVKTPDGRHVPQIVSAKDGETLLYFG